jgi:hypothetical protein
LQRAPLRVGGACGAHEGDERREDILRDDLWGTTAELSVGSTGSGPSERNGSLKPNPRGRSYRRNHGARPHVRAPADMRGAMDIHPCAPARTLNPEP